MQDVRYGDNLGLEVLGVLFLLLCTPVDENRIEAWLQVRNLEELGSVRVSAGVIFERRMKHLIDRIRITAAPSCCHLKVK